MKALPNTLHVKVFYYNYVPGCGVDYNWKSISVNNGGYMFNMSGVIYDDKI